MTPEELPTKLTDLISKWEQETIEFKQAGNDFRAAQVFFCKSRLRHFSEGIVLGF